ncbi:MAG: zf-HC2 domain-containing protein [Chromatiales bacterium]|jgi:hypothetical protein|nr:zf-HC2 domain-containing protein [Chromatiales bacterium]
MNCQEARNRLDDYIDEYSPPMERTAIELHIKACRSCTEALAEERDLRQRLRFLPAPEPDFALFSRTIAAAADAEVRQRRRWRWHTAGGALAAAVVLALGLSIDRTKEAHEQHVAATTEQPAPLASSSTAAPLVAMPAVSTTVLQPTMPVQVVTVVLDQESEITLALESGHRVDDATFTVELPEGIELTGYPGAREITWTGHLEFGKNLLVLPIKAQTSNGGDIVAHISDNQTELRRSLTLRMDVVAPSITTSPSPSELSPEAITVM